MKQHEKEYIYKTLNNYEERLRLLHEANELLNDKINIIIDAIMK
jgi:hypothetical protein